MGKLILSAHVMEERIRRARSLMRVLNVDALILTVSSELEWLLGYKAHATERVTAFVLGARSSGQPVLIAPELEVETLKVPDELFNLIKWSTNQDPFDMIRDQFIFAKDVKVLVGSHTWAQHLLPIQERLNWVEWDMASEVISQLRREKERFEIDALREVAGCVDRVIVRIQSGSVPLLGRTERSVAVDVAQLMRDEGHEEIGFVIVATGANAGDPHHEPDDTVIEKGHIVLFDIGGLRNGYCSDITRCVHMGEPSDEVRLAYNLLRRAQQTAFEVARPGMPVRELDSVARDIIREGGYGERFIHNLGHGIGRDMHEAPFVIEGGNEVLQKGDCFSIEPGIYCSEQGWGMRLEDIVYLTEDGAVHLNTPRRDLVVIPV